MTLQETSDIYQCNTFAQGLNNIAKLVQLFKIVGTMNAKLTHHIALIKREISLIYLQFSIILLIL